MVFDPFIDDGPKNCSSEHNLKQSLSELSLYELEERVSLLQQEIIRINQTIEQKKKTQAAADALFKMELRAD